MKLTFFELNFKKFNKIKNEKKFYGKKPFQCNLSIASKIASDSLKILSQKFINFSSQLPIKYNVPVFMKKTPSPMHRIAKCLNNVFKNHQRFPYSSRLDKKNSKNQTNDLETKFLKTKQMLRLPRQKSRQLRTTSLFESND